MSTVCHELFSCLDPGFLELKTSRRKLSSSFSNFVPSLQSSNVSDSETKELKVKSYNEEKTASHGDKNNDHDLGGWSFLQALSNTSQSPKEANEKESSYVHPLDKRSLSTLSEKSLEMCTENLGCETGTDVGENSTFEFDSSSSESEQEKSPTREQAKLPLVSGSKSANCRAFPPPLTSMSGSDSVQVRSHRESGRLVIKAVTIPSSHTCFHAERGEGRLRLRYLGNCSANFYSEAAEAENTEEEEEEEEEDDEVEDEEEVWVGEEMDGNNGNVGVGIGIRKLGRPRRCTDGKRGNKRLFLAPLCVSTS